MLTYHKIAELGYCPSTKYGYGKPFPAGFKLPETCPHDIFIKLPLQINVMYSTEHFMGVHHLMHQVQ